MTIVPDALRHPGLWPLLALALLPLLLHLLDRRRARRIDWPAVRFFITKNRARLRWMRLREVLLIAARTLALALFVWAMMGPLTTEEVAVRSSSSLRRGVVLSIDTSASMLYRHTAESASADHAPGTSLDRARLVATRIAADLLPGDTLVVLTTDASGPSETNPFDLDRARERIRTLTVSPRRHDLRRALDRAVAAAERLPTATRDIVLLTDLQASTVGTADAERWTLARRRLDGLEPRAELAIVDCGDPQPRNGFVRSLETDPLLAGTDEPFIARATASLPSDAPDGATLRWLVDGETVREDALLRDDAIGEPAGTAGEATAKRLEFRVVSEHTVRRPGRVRLRVELGGTASSDGLREDDGREVDVVVHRRLDVVVADGGEAPDGRESGYWVDLGLLPRVDGAGLPDVVFRPVRVDAVSDAALADRRIAVLADVAELTAAQAKMLDRHATSGGGVLVFLGRRANVESYDRHLWNGGRGILPARPVRRVAIERERDAVYPMDIAADHPALRVLVEEAEDGLRRVGVRAYCELADLARNARVLVALDGGIPWIVERPHGKGRVIFVASSAEPRDSDLPRTPLFLPLVHRLVRYLAAPVTDAPDAETTGEALVVDPEESVVERTAPDALTPILDALDAEIVTEPSRSMLATKTARVEREGWPAIVAAVLACLVMELALISRFARGRSPWKPPASNASPNAEPTRPGWTSAGPGRGAEG